ncbi:hypothetical protein [Actinoallomurus sp. CA-142502]|uniref:hypothetical protein n=1 Tax=Actinoallomurus sp. CA-142502 TaxID=3239885 RepID=UPI003D8C48C4
MVFALTGCSSHSSHAPKAALPTAITVQAVQPEKRHVAIPATSGESGYADVTQWPDACAFVSKAELTAVFPQAADISFEAHDVDLKTTRGREIGVAKKADCTIDLLFPGRFTDKAGATYRYGFTFDIGLDGVGDPQWMKHDYDEDRRAMKEAAGESSLGPDGKWAKGYWSARRDLGPGECFTDDGTWECHEKRMIFKVGVRLSGMPTGEHMNSRLRFDVAGQAPQVVDMVDLDLANESHRFVVQNVVTRLVQLVSAKSTSR